jgi:iron-sulfur cluster assembly protein
MISISDSALKQLASLIQADGKNTTDTFVRVGLQSGGCSGLSYDLTFDEQKKETDQSFAFEGITLLVDKKSLLYLVGTTLEYSSGLNGKGFVFQNPNATRTCGCGESFAV